MAERGVAPRWAAATAIAAVVATAATFGRRTSPTDEHPAIRDWYRALDKPPFTPPPIVFGIAWPLIEGALAVGAYRLLRRPSGAGRDAALALLLANQAGLVAWNELYFGHRRLGAGTALAGVLALSAGGAAAAAGRVDRAAGWSVAPLTGWLGFATVLAGTVWRRNPGGRPRG